MEFNTKLLFLTCLLIVGSQSFDLNMLIEPFVENLNAVLSTSNDGTKATIGELLEGPFCEFINETVGSLPADLQLFGDTPVVYNLSAVAGLLLNDSSLMSGQLAISNIALVNLPDTVFPLCKLITETSSSPLIFQLAFDMPLTLRANYTVTAEMPSVPGPITGHGVYHVGLDLDVELSTSIKYSPMFMPLEMKTFSYTIDVPTVTLNLEGVDGSADFVEQIEDVFEQHIGNGLSNLDESLHPIISSLITPIVNEYVLNGITVMDVIGLIGGAVTTTTQAPRKP